MALYEKLFADAGFRVAQVLLTHADLEHHERHLNVNEFLSLRRLMRLPTERIITSCRPKPCGCCCRLARALTSSGLNFRDVGDGHITVRSGKRQALRHVTITPTLRPWLVPFLGTEEFCQLPTPMAIARRAQAAGICLKFHRLRLSFIAYRLAVTGDVHLVAQEAGVTPILHLKVLYGNLEEAKKFWALTPEACGRANWTQALRYYLVAWFERKS